MLAIQVPTPHRAPIRHLARLTEDEFDAIHKAISQEKPSVARGSMTNTIQSALNSEDAGSAGLLLDAVLGAHTLMQNGELTVAYVAQAIAADPALDLSLSEQTRLRDRIAGLLTVEPLAALARAALLVLDDQTFCRARTLSDLRPVFVPNTSPPSAVGAVIRHTLLIRYHNDGPETEPFALSVDMAGLRELREVVERALAKDGVLRKMAQSCGMRIIDVEDAHE